MIVRCLVCSFQLVPHLEKSKGLVKVDLQVQNEGQFNLVFDKNFIYGKGSIFYERMKDTLALVTLEYPVDDLMKTVTDKINELLESAIMFANVIPIMDLDVFKKNPGYLTEPTWKLITGDPYFLEYEKELERRHRQ